jgi:chromosome segregation protein
MEEALLSLEQMARERDALHSRRQALHGELDRRRVAAVDVRGRVQQRALAMESLGSEVASTEQALSRLEAQRAELEARRERLLDGLAAAGDEADREGLENLLAERLQVEQDLNQARTTLAAEDETLRDMERARAARERQVQALREGLESQRVVLGESAVRAQTLLDQLGELELNLADALAALPDEDEAQLQEQLEKLTRQIQRLGPVNLAAIEEFTQLGERKDYLDAQNQDLETALSTLEEAIRRIDRETRSRFKETFERVSDGLRDLFPQLFGGGQAHLELTGEDVLDAGVAIMARPPGKRIGHIQLLSGGEKALTAVAFVFAIFQLNPAPFCMLDEVDAPLDEANVGRFGKLVRNMSEQVQFIFITHNKGTMEIAHHLSGVTMHEPGVSRLVSVDVAEAMRLAAE